MKGNINTKTLAKRSSQVLRNISQPARIRILLATGKGEVCVCHLEAYLGYRQAYISQHLMELRKAGIMDARREGRYIFYRLRDVRIIQLIEMAASLAGITEEEISSILDSGPVRHCDCPTCDITLVLEQNHQ